MMVERRRAKCSIDTVELSNEQDEQGHWVPRKYSVLDWVMLRPSCRGRFRVKRKDIQDLSKHWKARIKAFRIHPPNSSTIQALVQHVYMHKDLALGYEQAIGHKPNTIYPSTSEEWQSVECISGKITVYHSDIGSILYDRKLPSILATEGIFFYEALYVLPTGKSKYGKLQPIPPPTLNSMQWPHPNLEVVASYKLRFVNDIQAAMKPSTGSKGVHLSWLLPYSCFAYLFGSWLGVKRTKFTYTCKDLDQSWLDSCLGQGWDVKTTHEKETIQCIVTTQDVVFRYFIARQTLCMRYTYRRWRLVRGDWIVMDQDLRDGSLAVSVDITILWSGHPAIHSNVQSDWPLSFLRQEVMLMCSEPLSTFYFRLDGKTIRYRREAELTCCKCASPHVLELIESL